MRWLDRLEEWIVVLMLVAMTGLTFVQVVLRYVFNTGFTWALEMSTIFFAVMIFVGVSYGVRLGAHIGVDALVRLMPPAVRRPVSIFVVLLCLLYTGIVPAGLQPCARGVSCTEDYIELFGVLSIPALALLSFTALVGILVILQRRNSA